MGVPIVPQWLVTWLASVRTGVPFLALLSGLRIWCCSELWCRSQTWLGCYGYGVGRQPQLQLYPSLETSCATGVALKRQKTKTKKKEVIKYEQIVTFLTSESTNIFPINISYFTYKEGDFFPVTISSHLSSVI